MKYRNLTDDARVIPTLNITVEPGETTPELSPAESEGFAGQHEVWSAVEPPKTVATAPAKSKAAPVADEGNA